MTDDELKEASQKFCEYLEANGMRPLSMIVYVDSANRQVILTNGLQDMLDEVCITVLAKQRGFGLHDL